MQSDKSGGTMCVVRSHLLLIWILTLTACLLFGNGVYRVMGPESNGLLRFVIGFAGGWGISYLSKRVFNWWRRVD